MASFSDFMAQQQTAPTSSGSFSDFMSKKQPATSVGSDLKDAGVAYVGQTLHDANPLNAPGALAQMIAHPTAGMSDFRDKAAQDWSKGNYMDAAQHGVAGVIPVLGPLFGRTIDAINAYGSGQGSASDVGTAAADLTAVKTVPAIYEAVGGAVPVVKKYGPRVVENAPALGRAVADAVKSSGPDLGYAAAANVIPGIGHPISAALVTKAAIKAVRNGSLSDVWDAAGNLLNPTRAELAEIERARVANVYEASSTRGANAPWRAFPDVQAEQIPEARSIPATATPSGRVPGSFATQQPDLSTLPIGPRNAPLWQRTPVPEGQAAPASVTSPEPIQAQLPSGRKVGGIANQVTSEPRISPEVSVNGSSNALGTKPPTAETPGATLDEATHQKLIDATQNKKLSSLSAQDKATLVKAVKAGDADTVNSIIDGRAHSAVGRTDTAVINKTAVLSKYAIDHGIDLDSLEQHAQTVDQFVQDNNLAGKRTSTILKAASGNQDVIDSMEKLQSFADKAYNHGTKHGMAVPKSGYQGLSADTLRMVRDAVRLASPAVPAAQ